MFSRYSRTRGRCSPFSTLGGGGWEVSSWVRISRSVCVKLERYHLTGSHWTHWRARSQVSLSGWRRWQSANMSVMSVVVTQHIPDLITPQYQRDTAACLSQLPSGVMQRNRLLWWWLDAMASNQSQPRYNCFPAKTFRHGHAHPDEDNSDRGEQTNC